ncbi:DNA-dependent RNA polymerase domain-containing protein [Sarocladium implicatum]|nr:DNA-dependent RNA polymerase domain-containing protein [Sarocladium implicatum]
MHTSAPPRFDHHAPITIPEPQESANFSRLSKQGIISDIEDLFPVFDAFLRVGKLDRALLVLKRFEETGALSGEEEIVLHNQYLRACLKRLRASPDLSQAEQLHRWYELRIRDKLPHTAETIACMLKASLLSERGPRLGRLVRRYMSIAEGEAGLRVLSMADILSDQDLAIITDICPQYNLATSEDTVEDGFETNTGISTQGSEHSQQHMFQKHMPELIPTAQRGEGLGALKKGLSPLLELQDMDLSTLPEDQRIEFQKRLERETITSAIDRWRADHSHMQKLGINTSLTTNAGGKEGSMGHNMGLWLEQMASRIREEHTLIDEAEERAAKTEADLERCIYGPIIQQCSPDRLAAVTILTVVNASSTENGIKGIPSSNLAIKIARLVQDDLRMQAKEKAEKARRRRGKVQMTKDAAPILGEPQAERDAKQVFMDEPSVQARIRSDEMEHWSPLLSAHTGGFLLKVLLETAKVKITRAHPASQELTTQLQPAFTHVTRPRKGKKTTVVHMNPHLLDTINKEPNGDFLAKHLPMVAKPKPWRSVRHGGFYDSNSKLVRVKAGDVEQGLYARAAIKAGDMKQVLKGLDVLGQTAWRINNDLLRVMAEAWNRGEAIANMPPAELHAQPPPEPDASSDPLARRTWLQAVKQLENQKSGLHSQRCHMNLQLEIARMFRNQEIFFPHNIDYRGRAYPMPTYLNHMGADHTRALLRFSKGKELGTRGLRWLKIHLANVYGLDKANFNDREAFATSNLDKIIESATNPLDGSRWWLSAEDPWQCLATCMELKAAHELDDPTQYVCHMPVHQDGTCNGLQHYAALGGDVWGAKQVNLEPGDKPADVYSAVADLVKEGIAKDLENGNRFAEIMTGKITRKVVKQTVMTNVYGVTFAGAKKQVCKQIDALYPNLEKECGVPHIILSTYVAKHVFQALGSMFRGAHDIQYWLGEVGGRVTRALTPAQLQQIADPPAKKPARMSGSGKVKTASARGTTALKQLTDQFRSTIVWTTPLHMPVAQPYRKTTRKDVKTCLQTVTIGASGQIDPVNRRKQLQGFPPNFIHSLDASHMLLSALKCDELGLDFAAVHDSFWTHPADIDAMNGVLRESFVSIHQEDVVGRLAAEFNTRHHGSMYMAQVDGKSPVAEKIKEVRKSLNLSPSEELKLEHRRFKLMQSEDPEDQKLAAEMVTPASVYEKMAAVDEDVSDRADIEELRLGDIPEAEATVDLEQAAAKMQEQRSNGSLSQDDEEAPLDDALARYNATAGLSAFESAVSGVTKKSASKARVMVHVWLPLTVPPIPEKGEFDVTRLRESPYFFS